MMRLFDCEVCGERCKDMGALEAVPEMQAGITMMICDECYLAITVWMAMREKQGKELH